LPAGDANPFDRVSFPPRSEPFQFRQSLREKYRFDLNRGPTATFVDLEGIAPVCGDAPTGLVAFPPRNEPYAFRLELEAYYRDALRRGQTATHVDLEGDVVWTPGPGRSTSMRTSATATSLSTASATAPTACAAPPPTTCGRPATGSR
jgi:hypothetical protein